jgi:hypothetical protein
MSAACTRIHTAERVYVFTQERQVEIQTPAPWNLIGCSMTAPPLVLSTSSIFHQFRLITLTFFCKEKLGVVFQNVTFLLIFYFFKTF